MRDSGDVLMPTDDRFDQRLQDLREEIIRLGDRAIETTRVKAMSSRLNRPIWLLALSIFLGLSWYMWDRKPLDPFKSIIIAGLVVAIVLFLMRLVTSRVMVSRKGADS